MGVSLVWRRREVITHAKTHRKGGREGASTSGLGTTGVVLERCVIGGIVRGMNFGLRPRLAAADTADMEGTEMGVDWGERTSE